MDIDNAIKDKKMFKKTAQTLMKYSIAAFHLGLHCLLKYPFMVFPVYKGLKKGSVR